MFTIYKVSLKKKKKAQDPKSASHSQVSTVLPLNVYAALLLASLNESL